MNKKLLDYVRWTLQLPAEAIVTHKTLMKFMNEDENRGRYAAFLIARRAIDLALEPPPPK